AAPDVVAAGTCRAGGLRAGRLGPVPRPADGRRGLLDMARSHPGAARRARRSDRQLPGLARLRAAADGGAVRRWRLGHQRTSAPRPAAAGALVLDVRFVRARRRGVPRAARVGGLGRRADGRGGAAAGGQAAPVRWLALVPWIALTAHTVANAALLRRP